MIVTILIFIIILGLLVFVHEFGHFIVAKKSGMKVDEFGFGFPPRMVGIQKTDGRWKFVWGHREPMDTEQTVYSINWIPLGGFVRIMGENNEQENDPRSFVNRPAWGRFATLVAGVTMNLILAWVLMSIGTVIGLPHLAISETVKDQPAEKAGLRSGDVLLSIDGNTFVSSEQATTYIKDNQGKTFTFSVQREKHEQSFVVSSLAKFNFINLHIN